MAGELLNLYAERQVRTGHAFAPDGELQIAFEAAFPYRETADQLEAIDAVKADMEGERPMDRLICGDVGYGKTEVAMRAAHKAAADGKQVMMLVPTTILAQQHFGTFRERFADSPFNVEMVSRLRKPAEVKEALQRFARGQGRHPDRHPPAALARRPRQGPRAADRRRGAALRRQAEGAAAPAEAEGGRALALGDADPADPADVPGRAARHLGDRDPARGPAARSAPTSAPTTRSWSGGRSEREVERGGQAFFLHNRIETLHETAERLRALCPGVRFAEAHGQMDELELEATMLAFVRGEHDCLVATTIIESGLDIPTANTLIVERADQLGLSQAYQIRGRVGRSRERAYAYLLYPSPEALTRRRGGPARDALGQHRARLGLPGRDARPRDPRRRQPARRRAVRATSPRSASSSTARCSRTPPRRCARARGGEGPSEREPVRVDLDVDAYVPGDYVPFEAAKIDMHRRIAAARERGELRALRDELEDRFGPVPAAGREPARPASGADRARRRRGPHGRVPGRAAARLPAGARLRAGAGAARARRRRRSISGGSETLAVPVPDEPGGAARRRCWR